MNTHPVTRTRPLAWLAATLLALAGTAIASDEPFAQFGDTKIFYSVFNSSFIKPEVAAIYDIARGPNRGLVNISVVVNDEPAGRAAHVTGSATNLLGQQQTLDFHEVREGDSVYYLAPFRFDNEDPLNFRIQVRPAGEPERNLTFTRMLYRDR